MTAWLLVARTGQPPVYNECTDTVYKTMPLDSFVGGIGRRSSFSGILYPQDHRTSQWLASQSHPFNRAIPDRSVHPSLASGSAIALLTDKDPRRSCSRRKGHTTFCLARWKGLDDDDLSYALRSLSTPWLEVVREASRYNRVYRRAVCCTFHVYHWPVSALSIQRDGARRLSFGTEHATTGSSTYPLLVQRMKTDF
jgi:hypothetical protein